MLRTPFCSDSAKLDLYVQGVLPEAEATEIAEHADQCALCQASLERLEEQMSDLVQQLRDGFTAEESHPRSSPTTEETENDVEKNAESLTTSELLPPGGGNGNPRKLHSLMKRLEHLAEQPGVSRPARDWLTWAGLTFGRAADGQPMLGEFQLQRVLGAGGMGVVFQAFDTALERTVAIKVMRPEFAAEERNRERFLTEAQAMAAVSHANVVRVFRTGTFCGLPFLAMELLAGETLAQRLARGPALTLLQILEISRDVAAGLAAAHHHKLIHRDVKPDNIILEGNTTQFCVKLLDFGLARDISKSDLDEDRGWVLGTPAFMSPEQALGEAVTPRSDLFSLGCVLYRMLAGRLPFDGATPQAMLRARSTQSPISLRILVPTLSPELTRLVDHLLAGEPQRRPADAEDVVHGLERLVRRQRPRFTWREAAITGGLLVLIVGGLMIRNLLPSTNRGETDVVSSGTTSPRPSTASMATENVANDNMSSSISNTDNATTEHVATKHIATVAVRKDAPPLAPEWFQRVSNLPPEKQVAEVVAEMKRRNPDWDGTHDFEERGGIVRRFRFSPHKVNDLSPVRAFIDLEFLQFPGGAVQGDVFDLTPLTGLSLRNLDCGHNPISDFSPLMGMPLNILRAKSTAVKDLQPLSKLPLRILQLAETPVTELSAIRNCPLRLLSFWNTKVKDLSPLKGIQTLNRLECERTSVSDLSPLKGLQLTYLACEKSPIQDYSILKEFPLEELHISYDPAIHRELLRSISSLKRINYRPADEVLK